MRVLNVVLVAVVAVMGMVVVTDDVVAVVDSLVSLLWSVNVVFIYDALVMDVPTEDESAMYDGGMYEVCVYGQRVDAYDIDNNAHMSIVADILAELYDECMPPMVIDGDVAICDGIMTELDHVFLNGMDDVYVAMCDEANDEYACEYEYITTARDNKVNARAKMCSYDKHHRARQARGQGSKAKYSIVNM
jgi:hypothetical protein